MPEIELDPLEEELELDELELDDMSDIELDDEPEPGFFGKLADVGREALGGVKDIAHDFELQHKRREREAEGEVSLGLDFRTFTQDQRKRLGEKGLELQKSGKSYDEQLKEMNAFRAELVRESARAGQVGARRVQAAIPEPKHEADGFWWQAARGVARFAVPMVLSGINLPAGTLATFQAIRGNKGKQLEDNRERAMAQAKDPAEAEAIKEQYSDENIMDTATLHSILATPVEQLGTVLEIGVLKKILKASGASGRMTAFVKGLARNSATEGFEEWVQTHAEIITDSLEANPEASGEELASRFTDEFLSWKHQKKAGHAALLGGAGGLIITAPGGGVQLVQAGAETRGLTAEQKEAMKRNPLLTRDDFNTAKGLPQEEVVEAERVEAPPGEKPKKKAGAFGTLEEDIEVDITKSSSQLSQGLTNEGAIHLEEKVRTAEERREAATIAKRERIKREREEAQALREQQDRIQAQHEVDQAEAQRQAAVDNQRRFEDGIADRTGLVNQAIQLLPILENSGDPVMRKAAGPIKKAQQALAVGEDNGKRVMTIQNDLRVELQRVTDPRAQALMLRLDQELETEIARIDTLARQEELEKAREKETRQEPAKPTVPAPRVPAKVETKATPYKTEIDLVRKKAADKRAAQQAELAKRETERAAEKKEAAKGVEPTPYRTEAELALKKRLEKKVKLVKKAKPQRITVEEAPYKGKERQIYYVGKKPKAQTGVRYSRVKAAGQITNDTVISGTRFEDMVKKVGKGDTSVEALLKKVAVTQGKSFFVDVMHPGKIGARMYKSMRDSGIPSKKARQQVEKALATYDPVYNKVAARYLRIKSQEAVKAEARAQRVAAPTPGHLKRMRQDIEKGLAKAKLHLKNLGGIEIRESSTDILFENPILFETMRQDRVHGTVNAVFDKSTRKVYLFAEAATDVLEAKQALWHELGHYSLGELFGADANSIIAVVQDKYKARVVAKMNEGYTDEDYAAEEVIIDMFTSNEQNSIVNRVRNLFYRLARKLGFKSGELKDADIMTMAKMIRTNLLEGKYSKADIKRFREMARNYDTAEVSDLGERPAYQINQEKWKYSAEQEEFGVVNNRLEKELEVFERLFGPSGKASNLPGKMDTKTRKRLVTRTIKAYDLGQELQRVLNDGTLKRYIDPKVSTKTLADERNLKGKARRDFIEELDELRSGPLYVGDDVNIGKEILSNNDKAGMSADFLLGTCQPTQPCRECYAARAYFRMSAVRKAFRNTAYVLSDPKQWAKKVASEIKSVDQTKIPFIRLLGSGDMTFTEQVTAFNELAQVADRPIHIFSRHHDNLRKLKGTDKAPFIKMGSIDSQLYKHYGKKFLEENMDKYGIANAWLYTDINEIPQIMDLMSTDSIGLILAAGKKLHKKLPAEAQASSCPCDAGERGSYGSCRLCALSEAGCFMAYAEKGFDNKGKIWNLLDPKAPAGITPFTRFLRDVQKTKLPKKVEAISKVAVDQFSKSMKYVQGQIKDFRNWQRYQAGDWPAGEKTPKKKEYMNLKDIRWPDKRTRTESLIEAEAYKSNLEKMRDEAAKGTVSLPGGVIQPPIELEKGRARYQLKTARQLARERDAELAKFRTPPKKRKPRRTIRRPEKLTEAEQERADRIIAEFNARRGRYQFTEPVKQVIKEKQQVKDKIIEEVAAGRFTGAVRFAPMEEMKEIIRTGKLVVSKEFGMVHATPILGETDDAFPAYGDNNKRPFAMIVPKKYTREFKGAKTKEVMVDPNTPVKEVKFVVPGTFSAKILSVPEKPRYSLKTKEFRNWFKDSWARDVKKNPTVLYHGTTHDFSEFDPWRAHMENFFGRSIYFTNNPADSSSNYAGVGPDLRNRIEKETDELSNVIHDMDEDQIMEHYGVSREEAEDIEASPDDNPRVIAEAASRVKGPSEGSIMPVYLSIQNPLLWGGQHETEIRLDIDYDHYNKLAKEDIYRENYDNDEDYQQDLQERAEELYYEDEDPMETGTGADIKKAIYRIAPDWDLDPNMIWGRVLDEDNVLEGVSARTLLQTIQDIDEVGELQDYDIGEYTSREFMRQIVEEAGFDGIIMDAYHEFKRMRNVEPGTRHYMIFDPTKVKSIFNRGTWSPDTADVRYSRLTPAQKDALAHIGVREGTEKPDTNRLEMNWFERNFIQPYVDSQYALAKLEKGEDRGSMSGYKSFNLLSNFPAIFSSFLRQGRVKFQDNWVKVSPEGEGGLFNVQEALGDDADMFFKRMTAKSGKELLDKDTANVAAGKPSRFKEGVNLFGKHRTTGELLDDRKMISELMGATEQDYQNHKRLWDWAENRLRELNTSMLDFAEQSNLIDGEQRAIFEREFYIPFFRVLDEMEDGEVGTMFPKTPDPTHVGKLHRLAGSHRNVGDPFNNLVNTYSFVMHESLKNLARGKSLSLAKEMGLIEKTSKAGKDTVGVRVKGQETMYKVLDPLLYKALVDTDTITNGWLSENIGKWLLRKPKLWLTKFVTYDPAFRIANFLRDSLHTSFMQKGFIPIISSIRGGYHALRQTPEFLEFASTGGAFTGAFHEREIRAQTAEEIKRLKKRIKREKGTKLNPISWLDMYRRIGEAGENAARMGVYLIQKKRGVSDFEAAYAAKDLLDFHRSGASGMLSFMTQTVPFLNARIQGIYKLGRTAKDAQTRKHFALMSALLMGASTAYFFMGPGDDDRYKELTGADKMMYWHFFDVPGLGHVKIPKPFEIGAFFGSIPEAFMEYVSNQKDGKELATYIRNIFRDMLRVDMPQSAKVFVHQVANKDLFTGAPIVPPRQEGASPEVQYGERTSKAARFIGSQLQKLGLKKTASPRRIQKVFEDLFSYGTYLSSYLTDMIFNMTDMYPEDPAMQEGEGFSRLILGTGRFVKGEAVPKYTKSQQEFYEMMVDAHAAADTWRIYRRKRQLVKARQYRKEQIARIRLAKRFNAYQKRISKLNQKIDITLASRKLSADEKRKIIDGLLLDKVEIFKKAVRRGRAALND